MPVKKETKFVNLTIIVPTYNRSALLKRCLEFIRSQNANLDIIVADSSNQSEKEKNAETIIEQGKNVTYLEFDSSIGPVEKVLLAIDHVSTKFACLCADDDLIIVNAALRCAQFLERNPDYSACHGLYLRFSVEASNRIHFEDWEYRGPSLDADAQSGRAMRLLSNYEALAYSVQKKSTIRASIDAMKTSPFNMHLELANALWLALSGKVKRLEELYYCRQAGDASLHTHSEPFGYLAKRFPTMFSEYASMARELIEKFRSHNQGNVDDGLFDVLCFGFLVYLYRSIDLVHLAKHMIPHYPESDIARLREILPPTFAPKFRVVLRAFLDRVARYLTRRILRSGRDARHEIFPSSKGVSISRKLKADLPRSVKNEIEQVFARGAQR